MNETPQLDEIHPETNPRRQALSVQIKVLALVLVTAVAMFGAMLWKTESLLLQDKTAFITDSAMKQIAPLKRLVQKRLDDEKSALIQFAGIRVGQNLSVPSNQQTNKAMNATFGNFDVISLMQLGENGQWGPSWIEKNPNAKEERWPKGHDLTLLKSLSYSRVRDGEMVWARVSDRQGAPVYAFLISVEIQSPTSEKEELASPANALPDTAEQALANMSLASKAVLVGFSSVNPLAAVTEDFIGSTNSVYLVDDRGYVASHVNKAYQGALFTEDPLVREIIKGRKAGSTGRFEDLESRPVLGHYEKVEHSNLYAVITTPEQMLSAMIASQRNSALLWGFAVLLGCLGLASVASWYIARQATRVVVVENEEPVAALSESEAIATDGEDEEKIVEIPKPPPLIAAPAPVIIKQERPAGEKVLTDGLMQALTEPLHGILGHASLVRVKATDDEIQAHADSISREARRMRDVVERIHDWQDVAEETEKSTKTEERADLNVAITQALKKRDADLVSEDVHVIRELRPLPVLRGSQDRLEDAFGRLIENAIEAMQARSSKHLRIETDFKEDGKGDQKGNKIVLRLTDTGIGMSREVRDRAFHPFFKGFDSPARLGLGLSSVSSVVKAFGGTHAIESVMGEGTTFTFTFPVSEADREAFNQKEVQSITTAIASRVAPAPAPTPAPELTAREEKASEPSYSNSLDDAADDLKIEIMSPKIFASNFTEEIIEDELTPSAPATPAADSRPPTSGPLMLDELDDDDEMFANISLSKAASRLTKVGQIAPLKTSPEQKVEPKTEPKAETLAQVQAEPKKKSFEVKIRKPRMTDKGAE